MDTYVCVTCRYEYVCEIVINLGCSCSSSRVNKMKWNIYGK